MHRHSFRHDGLTFSFLDQGGEGAPVVALHGHWMGGDDFEPIAALLAPQFRLIALDQRGHGETDHSAHHSRDAYVGDVVALLDHLGLIRPVPLIGHSWGGAVAWLVAAAHADRVSALAILDMDPVRDDHDAFVRDWAGVFPLRDALEGKIGPRLAPYLQKSIRRVDGGWSLRFDPDEFLRSEQAMNGDLWPEWLASDCPALVIRAAQSPLTDAAAQRAMAERRPNTRYVEIESGHSIHVDAPQALVDTLRPFLAYAADQQAASAGDDQLRARPESA